MHTTVSERWLSYYFFISDSQCFFRTYRQRVGVHCSEREREREGEKVKAGGGREGGRKGGREKNEEKVRTIGGRREAGREKGR